MGRRRRSCVAPRNEVVFLSLCGYVLRLRSIMTFLNPLYLIALTAAAIPILLHLLNLRRLRVVEFSTLAFLKELQRSRIRRLKLKQWLLLLLRTLVIVFIVLAFTRPALRSAMDFLPGTAARNSVVIVLDDSYSMQVSDEGGRFLAQARARALAVCDLLGPGDEAALVRTSEAGAPHTFTSSITALRREIQLTAPTFTRADLREALAAASVLLQKSTNVNREVYVITDMQRTSFLRRPETNRPGQDRGPALRFSGIQTLFASDTRLYLLALGEGRPVSNARVSAVLLESSIFEKDKTADLTASISAGTEPRRAPPSPSSSMANVWRRPPSMCPREERRTRTSALPRSEAVHSAAGSRSRTTASRKTTAGISPCRYRPQYAYSLVRAGIGGSHHTPRTGPCALFQRVH